MYSYTYNSFTLAGNNDSYAWSTEGWDETPFASMTLEECAEEAHSTALKLLDIEIDQLEGEFLRADEFNDEGEPLVRNRTLTEVVDELTADVIHLEAHLYWWMVEAGDSEAIFDPEPFTVATSWWFNGAGGLDTLTVKAWASEAQFKEQNPNVKLVPARDGIRNHTNWMLDSVYDHPEGGEYYP